MKIVSILEQKIIDFLDRRIGVDAPAPSEETEEQQLQRKADIQQALELMRRQERIMEQLS